MSLEATPELSADARSALAGGGEMGARMRAFDWSQTLLGPVEEWPQSLKTTVSTILNSRFPIVVWWGPELVQLYNDAYALSICGTKHPAALGRLARDVWAEIWHIIGPMLEGVVARGDSTWSDDQMLPVYRYGYTEEGYFTFTYSPIRDETGGVGGVFCAVVETTGRVLGERRLAMLRELGDRTMAEARTAEDACQAAAAILARNPGDVPFALLYLIDEAAQVAHLAGSAGIERGGPASQGCVDLAAAEDDCHGWPLGRVIQTGQAEFMENLGVRFGTLPGGSWPEPAERALVLPIARAGQDRRPWGVLVAAFSPRCALDDAYRGFFGLVATQIATAVANARVHEDERRRADALAELDRAKTAFFSNVSHEFRTPLTLLLAPLDDAFHSGQPVLSGEGLALAHRNALRLLKLVNTLLDFSRVEAGRIEAAFEPTDLAAYTAELASTFRSAIERAGLVLVVDAPPLPAELAPVYVDREMWEKIVLNLLSNAFKHTFEGEISVSLQARAGYAELVVRDSGVGITSDELPRIFERFHRVPNARSRTHEGTGIGLALVQELVRLHGGTIGVTSERGLGTTFTITIPSGTVHLPPDHVHASNPAKGHRPPSLGAAPFVEEALRWLPDPHTGAHAVVADASGVADLGPGVSPAPPTSAVTIVVADDNADMRQYIARLLGEQGWSVETAADGTTALGIIREMTARHRVPDLLLTDVMMPGLDGFGLLRALRGEPATASMPVILLSARAGEESRVEGLGAGADDYLVKPFGARELTARIGAHLTLAQIRTRAAAEVAAANAELAESHRRLQEQSAATERAWSEAEQARADAEGARRRAEEANAAKAQFLAAMSHELRTPLNAIAGYAQLMELGIQGPLTEAQRDGLGRIQRSQQYLHSLINDVLNFAKLEAGRVEIQLTDVRVAEAVADVGAIIQSLVAAKGLSYHVDVAPGVIVRADHDKLQQVLLNLLSNAVKFTGRGGRVTLDTPAHDEMAGTPERGVAYIRISDTGLGIPRGKQDAIFDPFVQLQRDLTATNEGTGLGLAISRDLARAMGGDVRVRSVEGQGSAFTIVLPAAGVDGSR